MAAMTSSRVRPVLEPVVTAAGYDLEDVNVTAAGRRSVVRVVVDRDGGIDLDAVAEVSRAVSDALDAADSLGSSPYVLEVTSPGVDRPLTLPRHWRRNVGRLVRAGERSGRIVAADEDGVTLDIAGEQQVIGYPELGAGQVQVEFSRPGGGGAR
jgi:ribosome maturation factor RimP